jgi:hypothetical protein
MRKVAGGALSIGLPNGDVEAAVTDGARASRDLDAGDKPRLGRSAATGSVADKPVVTNGAENASL